MSKENNNGITLIALIITIIIMLILVGVSVTVALNGGLFNTANKAKQRTVTERDEELLLDEGQLEVNGKKYANYQDYLNNKPILPYKKSIEGLAEGVSLISYDELLGDLKKAADEEKIIAVIKETIDGTETKAIIPAGFEVSTTDGEDSISGGLVISDARENEFVWIPVENAASYTEENLGPLTGTDTKSSKIYDSQEELDYYYGTDEEGNSYYSYSDFNYEADKTNIETSIQKYGGFYVGRYETTYDGVDEDYIPQGIGIKRGKNVLEATRAVKSGTNPTTKGRYNYRWWGLYKVQKDMYADNPTVGSLMISSKQWDAIMEFTGYSDEIRKGDTYLNKYSADLSGSAYATDNSLYDLSKNIYDLAGNVCEFTLQGSNNYFRDGRGGYGYNGSTVGDASYAYMYHPTDVKSHLRI